MTTQKNKTEKFLRAVRIAKAVSTLTVVALPVMTARRRDQRVTGRIHC